MIRMRKFGPILLLSTLALSGCGDSENSANTAPDETSSQPAQSSQSSLTDTGSVALESLTLDNAAEADVPVIDVRTPEEFAAGHIPGAVNIPLDDIETDIASVIGDKNAPFALYCRSGNRSGQALMLLENAGYTTMVNLGGIMNYSGPLETGN